LEKEFNNLKIIIKEGNCNEILKKLTPNFTYDIYKRVLLFLDPFGMSVDWEIIEAAAKTKTFEIFLNMPIMAINRACLLNDPSKLKENHKEKMNVLWGNNEWESLIYKDSQTLFGTTKVKDYIDSQKLSNYFTNRLKSVFTSVSQPLIMRNSKNTPLYCLIYAGHNNTGKKIIENIFKHFEKLKKVKLLEGFNSFKKVL